MALLLSGAAPLKATLILSGCGEQAAARSVRAERERHVGAVRAPVVVREWPAGLESGARVKGARGREGRAGAGLQADPSIATLSRHADQVLHKRPPDALAAGGLGGVHRLDLGVVVIEPLEGGDAEHLSVEAVAEEGDGRVEQRFDVEGIDILRPRV